MGRIASVVQHRWRRTAVSKAVYRVVDRETLHAALRSCPEIDKDDEGKHYVWLRGPAGEQGRTVLAHRVEDAEMVFELQLEKTPTSVESGMLAELAGLALKHLPRRVHHAAGDEAPGTNEPRAERQCATNSTRGAQQTDCGVHGGAYSQVARYADSRTRRENSAPRLMKTAAGRSRSRPSTGLREYRRAQRQAGEPFYDVARLRAELGLKE